MCHRTERSHLKGTDRGNSVFGQTGAICAFEQTGIRPKGTNQAYSVRNISPQDPLKIKHLIFFKDQAPRVALDQEAHRNSFLYQGVSGFFSGCSVLFSSLWLKWSVQYSTGSVPSAK
ncbi:hypothetical protein DFO70_104279 [Cytobacillus firmus]|uniref:Uncharacterized protein n=1 Tax=Cytobacillus firmus TaxID=1399 RepID=A0A366K0F6_CYTFI|nr:hypothetical protein DFO70_104279 [Cytobacillus firmus]